MCTVNDSAAVIVNEDVRVVVLLMSNLCNYIDECDGLVIVFKHVGMADHLFFFV